VLLEGRARVPLSQRVRTKIGNNLTYGDKLKGAPSASKGPRPDWRVKALCRGYSTEQEDPWDADPKTKQPSDIAASICKQCPVRRECLLEGLRSDALNAGSAYMVWGGLAPAQRRALSRLRYRVGCPVCSGVLLISPEDAEWQVCVSCAMTWRTRKPKPVEITPDTSQSSQRG
jgi:hypothetical protein